MKKRLRMPPSLGRPLGLRARGRAKGRAILGPAHLGLVHLGLLGALSVLSFACGGAAIAPENQATTTISLQDITCSTCANSAAAAAKATPG